MPAVPVEQMDERWALEVTDALQNKTHLWIAVAIFVTYDPRLNLQVALDADTLRGADVSCAICRRGMVDSDECSGPPDEEE
jgi:hypothetical protein